MDPRQSILPIYQKTLLPRDLSESLKEGEIKTHFPIEFKIKRYRVRMTRNIYSVIFSKEINSAVR